MGWEARYLFQKFQIEWRVFPTVMIYICKSLELRIIKSEFSETLMCSGSAVTI
jgi:hypothetical protein